MLEKRIFLVIDAPDKYASVCTLQATFSLA